MYSIVNALYTTGKVEMGLCVCGSKTFNFANTVYIGLEYYNITAGLISATEKYWYVVENTPHIS